MIDCSRLTLRRLVGDARQLLKEPLEVVDEGAELDGYEDFVGPVGIQIPPQPRCPPNSCVPSFTKFTLEERMNALRYRAISRLVDVFEAEKEGMITSRIKLKADS